MITDPVPTYEQLPHQCPICGSGEWTRHFYVDTPPLSWQRHDQRLGIERKYTAVRYHCKFYHFIDVVTWNEVKV